jgi:lipopolysaccharide export system protein LptA
MNKTFRIIIFLVFIALIILFLTPFFSKAEFEESQENPKKIEIKGSQIFGYDKKEKIWEVNVDYVWTGRSKFLFRAENLTLGRLFGSKGQVVVDDLKAKHVKVNSRSKTLFAFNNISAAFIRGDTNKNIVVEANELKYYNISKRTYIKHNVILKQAEYSIFPSDQLELDNSRNIAYINSPFVITSTDLEVTANRMVINIDNDEAELYKNIQIKRTAKTGLTEDYDLRERILRAKDTYLKCNYINYKDKSNNTIISIKDNFKLSQSDKSLKAHIAFYDKELDIYVVEGDIKFEAESLIWIIDKNRKKSFNNKEMEKNLKSPIKMSCNKMIFNAKDETIILLGEVKINQENQEIRCQKFLYDDADGKIFLYGGVTIIRKGQDTLQSNEAVIDIMNESIYADQKIKMEFDVN